MARPAVTEWEVLDLTEDPTPGDPDILQRLVTEYQSISDDAESAFGVINRVKNQEAGAGQAMDKLQETLDDLPNQVGALRDSYDKAAAAIRDYIPKLRDHQNKAALALADGQAASARLAQATLTASIAAATVTNLSNATPPPPDDENAKTAARRALEDARSEASAAQSSVDSAQADLDAARRLALDAQALREADASAAATAMNLAQDDAVKKKNFWDKLWDTIGAIFGIISAVLGIVSFLIPGLQGLGLLLGGLSLTLGLIPLGINIARGVVTGDWDVVGIVLGVVGTAFGGFAVLRGAWQAYGNTLKGALGGGRGAGGGTGGSGGSGAGSGSGTGGGPPRIEIDIPSGSLGNLSDDIPLANLPPRPGSGGSGAGSGSGTGGGPPRIEIDIPSGSLGDIPHVNPRTPPGTPTGGNTPPGSPGVSIPSALPSSPGWLGQYLQSLAGQVRTDKAGTVGFTTALAGLIYGPVGISGHARGAVAHGSPLVGNTNTDGT